MQILKRAYIVIVFFSWFFGIFAAIDWMATQDEWMRKFALGSWTLGLSPIVIGFVMAILRYVVYGENK